MGSTPNRRRSHHHHHQHHRSQPRRSSEQQTSSCKRRIGSAFKKSQTTKTGLDCSTILSLINCFPNFLGCFAQDTLDTSFMRPPCTFIVNIDSYNQKGSHWLAIGLFELTLEVFDPLGFSMFLWESVPCNLLRFLHRYGQRRKILISKRVQPLTSHNCAFYSLYYILNRDRLSFEKIQNKFHRTGTNERVLNKYFFF